MSIIADPDACDQQVVEADEPGVAIVLAGASLAGRKAVERGGAPGTVAQHALQQIEQRFLVGLQGLRPTNGRPHRLEARLPPQTESRHAPRFDRHFPGLYCSISRSEFEQVHFGRSESQAWDRRKRSSDAEVTGSSDDPVQAHLLTEPSGCSVD